jgi:hypothetical protein
LSSCAYGKQTKGKFPILEGQRTNFMLNLVHLNVCGFLHSGFKYFLTFIDDKSIKFYVYFMKKNMNYLNISKYGKLKKK